ncbi:hypothetical protein C8J57DRAFT_1296043 [Mycena rebaudengoi]|nr:hypothetical protein C8J57DRAFT_1296043 [Mycena rebaudengoi]
MALIALSGPFILAFTQIYCLYSVYLIPGSSPMYPTVSALSSPCNRCNAGIRYFQCSRQNISTGRFESWGPNAESP